MDPIPTKATLYHYRTNEKTVGPVSKEVIDTLAAAGKLPFSTTMVRKEGSRNWVPLSAILQRRIKFKAIQPSKKEQPSIRILFYAAAAFFFCFGIVIFFLTNHAELEVIILIPCILIFMGKLLCYAHTLVEKCGITAAPDRE